MAKAYLGLDRPFLDSRFPLPLDQPFTRAAAAAAGLTSNDLTDLLRVGLIRRMVENVYVAAQVVDSLGVRVEALKLVVPSGAVVTDRTAAWLHGAEHALAPGDHREVPRISVFKRARGLRLRNQIVASGQRVMPESDIVEIGGLAVTTPVRTACDLGDFSTRMPRSPAWT